MTAPVHAPYVYPDNIMSVEYKGTGADANDQSNVKIWGVRMTELTKCSYEYQHKDSSIADVLVRL